MGKKNPQPKRLCIFCSDQSGARISKEHIFPDWMRDFLPEFDGTTHLVNSRLLDRDTGLPVSEDRRIGMLNQAGDHRSRKLKVVCTECNGGWMSVLQAKAKPILIPLIQGEWKSGLSVQEQTTLAAWAAMYTMVREFAADDMVAVPQEDRDYLRLKREAPPHWFVWIGPFEGIEANAAAWHRSWGLHPAPIASDAVALGDDPQAMPSRNIQTMVFAAGKILFQTFCSAAPGVDFAPRLRSSAAQLGLRRIWPSSTVANRSGRKPPSVMSGMSSLERIVTATATVVLGGPK
jgi:hypothetical protein